MADACPGDAQLHSLFAAARRRMCEILRTQPPPDEVRRLLGEQVWQAHLTPENCNPGGVYQHENEPWWWYWYAWSPDGQLRGVADGQSDALDRVTAVWSGWL